MGAIEDIYADLDADVSEEEFREAVEQKVEQMGGLADEETAAMLIAHDLGESEVEGIADIEPGMEEAKFVGKVVTIGEVRTFEREGEDEPGRVCNIEVADETGRVRVALWDDQATAAGEELAVGDVLRVAGRPKEGYNGLEVSADRVEADDETDIDVEVGEASTVESLSLGQSDVTLRGLVLDTDRIRTFSRDDGSEGRVANLTLGDETGRVRVTLWDERADRADELDPGTSVEVVDGYVRERDGQLELHVGSRGAVEEVDEEVGFVPEATDIADVELGDTVDIAGVVRSTDPKRTFDRDDGSEGQVRNIRVQDQTGDIRVALWGDKADRDVGPGDEVLVADVEIQDGWQEDLEASAGWRSTVTVLDGSLSAAGDAPEKPAEPAAAGGGGTADAREESQEAGLSAFAGGDAGTETSADASDDEPEEATAETVEFTGTVVQPGDPVILDDGERTLTVETGADVRLGQEVTVRGRLVEDDRVDADEVF